jgi:hypothetical protein
MQPGYGHTRTLRLFAVALALLVLLALVAFSSHTGFGHTSDAKPTPGYVSWAMSVFLILFILMIPVAAWAYSVQMREFKLQNRTQRTFKQRMLRTLGIVVLILVILGGRQILKQHGYLPKFDPPWLHRNGKGTGGLAGADKNHYDPTFQWPVLWVFLAVALVAGGYLWWQWRKRAGNVLLTDAAPTIEEDVAATITDAIDDLEAEPDARRAVIAAYARMERTLARHGLQRLPSETALEYLRRILLGLTSRDDAVTKLTSLFERAKFSTHEIDSSMKSDAISALRTIRDDLQGAPA